jgi:outer membrane lipoprotein-sorting protein
MVALIKHRLLFTTLLAGSVLSAFQAASAVEPTDVEADLSSLTDVAKSTIKPDFVESLRAGPAKFQDYQCYCRLYAKKGGKWKDMGGAQFAYKFKNLFKAVIKTSDYRNGSVVVRNPEGELRGSGGGTLRFVKMTLQPDSRTLQLPTGYSLAKSDFLSLYDAIKTSLASGATGQASSGAVSSKLFGEPVTVLVIKKGGTSDSSISEVIVVNPKTKLPTLWMTFKAGQPDAIVFFEDVQPNKGFNDNMFSL